MQISDLLIFYDISSIIILLVLAYLSKRLGEALKIAPFFKLFYVAAVIVAAAQGIDISDAYIEWDALPVSPLLCSIMLRCAGMIIGFSVSLIYWKWLFGELFNK